MGTDYKRDLREQREDERRQAALDADRRADMTPAPRVLRTPRERVAEYIEQAAAELGREPDGRLGALVWLDKAREVLDSPNVVDGAVVLRGTLEEARDAAEEGEYGRVVGRLDAAIELLRRQVRYADDEIPVPTGANGSEQARKRSAVLAVLARHRMELSIGEPSGELLDELVVAAETGV